MLCYFRVSLCFIYVVAVTQLKTNKIMLIYWLEGTVFSFFERTLSIQKPETTYEKELCNKHHCYEHFDILYENRQIINNSI